MLQKIKSTIAKTKLSGKLQDELLHEVYAAQQLSGLLNNAVYLPFSSSSLNYSSIAVLLNDIIINNRKTIVEFGSGITTYLIARLFKRNYIEDATLITVDENADWLNIVKNLLEKEELLQHINFVHAPLVENKIALNNLAWYNTDALTISLNNKKVDCVLVDGPSAWHKEIQFARYPALPFIHSYLSDSASVFLDDTNRYGEKHIIKLWSEKFDLKYQSFGNSFAGFFKGESFNINLFR